MDRETISTLVNNAAPELRARGLGALYLFGSRVREEARDDSDIDIAFDVTEEANANFSIIDQASAQIRLEEIFGRKVDFFERRALHRRFGDKIDGEMVRLF